VRPKKKPSPTPAFTERALAFSLPPSSPQNKERKRPKKGNFQKPDYQRTRHPIERAHFNFSLAPTPLTGPASSAKRSESSIARGVDQTPIPITAQAPFSFSPAETFVSKPAHKNGPRLVRNGLLGSRPPAAPKAPREFHLRNQHQKDEESRTRATDLKSRTTRPFRPRNGGHFRGLPNSAAGGSNNLRTASGASSIRTRKSSLSCRFPSFTSGRPSALQAKAFG